jgi:hypothetical protein
MSWYRSAALIAGGAIALAGIAGDHAHANTSKIQGVVLDAGNPGKTLSAGYSTIEQATVHCSIYRSCTLQMRVMANVGSATCKSQWAIVALVDGNSVDGGPLLDTLPNAGNTQTDIWQGIYTTATGAHTITFQLYLPCAANINQWSVRYLVTKP